MPNIALVAALSLLGVGIYSPAWAQVDVPVAACSGSLVFPRGTDPQPIPPPALPASGTVGVALPETVASRLEAYIYAKGIILAPRGWRCDYDVDGGYGSDVSVRPDTAGHNPYVISESFMETDGYLQGQQHAQILANTYFPKTMKKIYAGHEEYWDKTDTLKTYKTDIIRYESDRELDFVTPAHHIGLGSPTVIVNNNGDTHLVVQDLPIQGFISMSTVPDFGGYPGLCEVFVYEINLPANLFDLETYLVKDAKSRPEAKPTTTDKNCSAT